MLRLTNTALRYISLIGYGGFKREADITLGTRVHSQEGPPAARVEQPLPPLQVFRMSRSGTRPSGEYPLWSSHSRILLFCLIIV